MASQVGNVSRDGKCTNKSTECANNRVAMNVTNARNSTEKSAEAGCMGLDGLRTVQERGTDDQPACRLHVIRDGRKSVFTLRIRVFTGAIATHVNAMLPFAIDYRACLPIQRAAS